MAIEVEAISSFDKDGMRRIGDRFFVSERTAQQLERKQLAIPVVKKNPAPAALLSASPAAPASPKKTAKPSASGGKPAAKKTSGASSSPT